MSDVEKYEMDGDGRGEWERARRVKSFPTPPMERIHRSPYTPIGVFLTDLCRTLASLKTHAIGL